MRDDFDKKTKDILFRRAGARCSNPDCRKETCGSHSDDDKAINIGVAAHITAASEGGPRYDPTLSTKERKSTSNGIWLCETCAKLIDSDIGSYSIVLIKHWKIYVEKFTRAEMENRISKNQITNLNVFNKLEKLMPDLINEMRQDLLQYPLRRELVLLKKSGAYWAGGNELCYYYDEHNDLDDKIRILCNYNLISEITFNNVKRYILLEELAEYLTRK